MTVSSLVTARAIPAPRPLERGRGRWAMAMFIATEAALFANLFFAYVYLGLRWDRWPPERPSLLLAGLMTAVLVTSSVVLVLGERAVKRGSQGGLIGGLTATVLLGAGFLAIQAVEYRHHLQRLTPGENAYGSIFYAITGVHAAHVFIGLLLVAFALVRAMAGHFDREHHQAVTTAGWYWHFVDLVWICIYATLYLAPRFYQ